MIRTMRTLAVLLALLGLLLLAGCARDAEPTAFPHTTLAFAHDESRAGAVEVVVEREVIREVPVQVSKAVVVEKQLAAMVMPVPAAPPFAGEGSDLAVAGGRSSMEEAVALVTQRRIIVRTVEIELVVANVPATLDSIAGMAREMGGWVVSSDRSRKHRGLISVRVPAERLDDAVLRLRDLAEEVEAEVSTSRDVTDEYVDATARLKNLEATEEALLRLLDRAEEVEHALEVQKEMTRVQQEIERLLGRIKFLEETSAFSLVNVGLSLRPAEMAVDAGEDQTVSIGQVTRFRASFRPPEGIEDFIFTWDFGDGSEPVRSTRTAPSLEDGARFTATIAHLYRDDSDSPFIAEVEIEGTGDAGTAEGNDTMIVTVTRLPSIEVFAGESRVVREGDEVEFEGTFTRPEGLSDLTFRWEFGDGSQDAAGSLGEGVTKAVATHVYSDHRPLAYTATLTITAQSEAGEVEASHSVRVLVTESPGWVISGWSPGDTWKMAVRGLSGMGRGSPRSSFGLRYSARSGSSPGWPRRWCGAGVRGGVPDYRLLGRNPNYN